MRPRSEEWAHFKKCIEDNKECAICNYCGQKYLFPNITRLKKHLSTCNSCPTDVKQKLARVDIEGNNEEEHILDTLLRDGQQKAQVATRLQLQNLVLLHHLHLKS